MKQILVLMIISSLTGCSSATLISTNDKDVKIYVDGEFAGKGQHTHVDSKIVGSTTTIILKKEGCEDVPYKITRNEQFDIGACAGGLFLIVPLLWVQKYKAKHEYNFECIQKN
ncbi:MAG: hypothetical protein Q7U04_16890 [Bacteriovorax sp.]|nr:hypothetical protein [Bacteriovorax sp.]